MSYERRHKLLISLRYTLLVLIAAIFIFPIVFMVMSSLKPDLQLLRDSGSLRAFLPVGDISLTNYADAFERVPIVQFAFNSIFTTAVAVAASIFLNSMAAFSFAFLQWRGKALLLSLIIATFIVPFEVIAIPLLLVVNNLPWLGVEGIEIGWLNSYHVQIIPFIADSLGIFLFYQYFRDLPDELVEAARIDGASVWQIYARIIMPIAGPILATVAILKFLGMWNAYIWPLMTHPLRGIASHHGGPAILLPAQHPLGRDHGLPVDCDHPGADLLPGIAARLHREHRHQRHQGLSVLPSLPARSSRCSSSCRHLARAE